VTDRFGAVDLPIPAPAATTDAVSDPALDLILSFVKAVFNNAAGTAWTARAAGDATPVVTVFAHDPEKADFVDRDLPALFLYRTGGGTYEDEGADLFRENPAPLRLRWAFPPTVQGKRAVREPIINGLSKVLASALAAGRHPSWTVSTDLEDTDAILLPTATSTIAQSLTAVDFTGESADGTIEAARPITVTTTAATAAYNTTDPVVLTFELADGTTFEESVYLASANGGETVACVWRAQAPIQADIPAQFTTTGTIALGYADSPEVRHGSVLKRYAGLSRLALAGPGRPGVLRIVVDQSEKTLVYPTVDFDIVIQEILSIDKASTFDELADASDDGQGDGPLGAQFTFIYPEPDGETYATAYFPDE
jgi:hypothetical protein